MLTIMLLSESDEMVCKIQTKDVDPSVMDYLRNRFRIPINGVYKTHIPIRFKAVVVKILRSLK